jgi:WXG100 family type VII secretion target
MTISANFGQVEEQAQSIVSRAGQISNKLEEFHNSVRDYVANHGSGAANDAFGQLQTTWHQKGTELNQVLVQASHTVSQGNSDLQSKDQQLSGLF